MGSPCQREFAEVERHNFFFSAPVTVAVNTARSLALVQSSGVSSFFVTYARSLDRPASRTRMRRTHHNKYYQCSHLLQLTSFVRFRDVQLQHQQPRAQKSDATAWDSTSRQSAPRTRLPRRASRIIALSVRFQPQPPRGGQPAFVGPPRGCTCTTSTPKDVPYHLCVPHTCVPHGEPL